MKIKLILCFVLIFVLLSATVCLSASASYVENNVSTYSLNYVNHLDYTAWIIPNDFIVSAGFGMVEGTFYAREGWGQIDRIYFGFGSDLQPVSNSIAFRNVNGEVFTFTQGEGSAELNNNKLKLVCFNTNDSDDKYFDYLMTHASGYWFDKSNTVSGWYRMPEYISNPIGQIFVFKRDFDDFIAGNVPFTHGNHYVVYNFPFTCIARDTRYYYWINNDDNIAEDINKRFNVYFSQVATGGRVLAYTSNYESTLGGWYHDYNVIRIDGFPQCADVYFMLYDGATHYTENDLEYLAYINGYDAGYHAGIDSASSISFGENLLGDTIKAPLDALNSLVLYRTSNGTAITLFGVFGAIIGVCLLIWFLKMFAGG